MPTCPRRHPLAVTPDGVASARSIPPRPVPGAATPTGARPAEVVRSSVGPDDGRSALDPTPAPRPTARGLRSEDGSVATEYGLLAVVAATIVSVLLEWATSGGITTLLSSVLARVSELVGL